MTLLEKGVYLHVFPTEKFKTIRVNIRFTAPLEEALSTKRTLLASLLETNSKRYKSQQEVNHVLADLYGTSFGIQVNKKGTLHYVTATLNVVNDKFLNEKGITQKAFDFLKEMLFYPNLKDGFFHLETFNREKENLMNYITSVYEDKQSYAALQLQSLYFKDAAQKEPSFGTRSCLKTLTNQQMVAYYNDMIKNDRIDISVVGDVSEKEIKTWLKAFPFVPRTKDDLFTPHYEQSLFSEVQMKEELQEVKQAKLHLAYHVPKSLTKKQYFTAIVFNGLFGGFAHSKLFMNVREKESLAYYASSSLDTFCDLLTVQTGIDGKNKERVLALINKQLESLQQGEISALSLLQTKENLKNQFYLQQDSPQGLLEWHFRRLLLNETWSESLWLQQLQDVSVEDVSEYAKQVTLQSIYMLREKKNENKKGEATF